MYELRTGAGGVDNTTNVASFFIYNVATRPDIQQAIYTEIQQVVNILNNLVVNGFIYHFYLRVKLFYSFFLNILQFPLHWVRSIPEHIIKDHRLAIKIKFTIYSQFRLKLLHITY